MGLNRIKLFKLAKGFRGRAKNCLRIARLRVERSLQNAYRGRKEKKRDARALWIARINAGSREHGIKYSQLMHGLQQQNIQLNRKMLSELAMYEPHSFRTLVEQVRFMRGDDSSSGCSSSGVRQQAAPAVASDGSAIVEPRLGGG